MIAVLFFVLAVGCVSSRTPAKTPASVAKEYAVNKFGFSRPKIDHIIPSQTGYEVFVWDMPYRPGGNMILFLSKDLRLIDWASGR